MPPEETSQPGEEPAETGTPDESIYDTILAGYTDEMMATLLMPAGITSLASIRFKDEEKLLSGAENPDEVYLHTVLPQKMKYNLEYINRFSFFYDIKLMFMTFFAVL